MREIKREADRAVGVIRELLTFSRKTGPRLAAVDLNALVNHTCDCAPIPCSRRGLRCTPSCDASPPLAIGDEQRLQQVMLNLVVNAEYAMHRSAKRVLTVGTARRVVGGIARVVIDVTDTGAGMTPEVLSHIFEPFFTTKPAGVGTGLGLSVSYTIIQAHGGTIDVRSTPGVGTTFTVALPEYVAPGGHASSGTGLSSVPGSRAHLAQGSARRSCRFDRPHSRPSPHPTARPGREAPLHTCP